MFVKYIMVLRVSYHIHVCGRGEYYRMNIVSDSVQLVWAGGP